MNFLKFAIKIFPFLEVSHQNISFFRCFPSKYFLFGKFLAFLFFKNIQKRKSPVKLFPKKEISIPSVKKNCTTFLLPEKLPKKEILISPVNSLKRELPFHLSKFLRHFFAPKKNAKKGNFHSTCQFPKKETSIPPVNILFHFLTPRENAQKRNFLFRKFPKMEILMLT